MRWQRNLFNHNNEPAVNYYDLIETLEMVKSLASETADGVFKYANAEPSERDKKIVKVTVELVVDSLIKGLRAERESLRI